VKESDEEMRAKSNRTYRRILSSLPTEVARRFGHVEAGDVDLEAKLQSAIIDKDWPLAADLSAHLAGQVGPV
jgi:phage terminase Nu1 subunit (DNA packaging protein)